MAVAAMTLMMIGNLLLFRFFRLFATLLDYFDVVVEDSSDDGHHVSLDDTRPDVLGAPYADVEDALEGQVPLPHVHHVLAAALLEDAYQAFDATIDGQDVAYAGRRGCEVGEVVERVDERERRCLTKEAAPGTKVGNSHSRRKRLSKQIRQCQILQISQSPRPFHFPKTLYPMGIGNKESVYVDHSPDGKHAERVG